MSGIDRELETLLADAYNEVDEMRAEVEHLRQQRDELQAENTREVERRRETEANAAAHAMQYLEQFGMRYPERLAAFAKSMAAKLDANAAKGDWRDICARELLLLLEEEFRELSFALHTNEGPEAVVGECVDVALFAMMIADVVRSNECISS